MCMRVLGRISISCFTQTIHALLCHGQGTTVRRNSFSRQRAKLQEQSVREKDNQDLHLPDTSLHRFILHPYTVSFGLVWFLHALRLFHQPHWKSNCVFHLQCTVQTTGQRDFLSIVTFSCSRSDRSDILYEGNTCIEVY